MSATISSIGISGRNMLLLVGSSHIGPLKENLSKENLIIKVTHSRHTNKDIICNNDKLDKYSHKKSTNTKALSEYSSRTNSVYDKTKRGNSNENALSK